MTIADLPRSDTPTQGRTLSDVLGDAQSLSVVRSNSSTIATSFDPLDTVLGGGLRRHDMTIIGGRPGVGKTVAGLQWARAAAIDGATAIVISYEHDPATILGRLFAMEVGLLGAGGSDRNRPDELTHLVRQVMAEGWSLNDDVGRHPIVRAALARLETYADNLLLVPGSTRHTDLDMIDQLLTEHATDRTLLVVDYIQKVPVFVDTVNENDRLRVVAEGLKQLAIDHPVSLLAVAAANESGLNQKRVRLESLRGAQSIGYECDVLMMLNSKWSAVSRKHITFDLNNAENFKKYVVFSVEKNRTGPDNIDLEFEKVFEHYHFKPRGQFVSERLIDGSIVLD